MKRTAGKDKQPNRGMFLSSLTVIFAVAITFASVILIFDQGFPRALGSLPGWFNLYVAGLLLARLIALYAIWVLKRWGVFALFALECVEFAGGLFVFTGVLSPSLRLSIGVPLFLVVLLIWYLALRPKWQQFT